MSLINDALKHAKRAQQRNLPPIAPVPPLHPVETTPRGGNGWMLLAAGVLIVAGGLCIWLALSRREPTRQMAIATNMFPVVPAFPADAHVPPARVAPAPPATGAPPAVPSLPAAANTSTAPIAANPPAPNPPVESNVVTTPPPPPPPPPEPKLQGIILINPSEPWAIVDGRTVSVGDDLGDFRVKEILGSAVTLEKADGTQKVLKLRR